MKIDLYCFPYAGASSMMYSTWKRYLSPHYNLKLIELAGRGSRLNDIDEESIENIGKYVFKQLSKQAPYMLFGHSMGVLIIGEILKNIFKYDCVKPQRVCFSGRNPLHLRYEGASLYDEDDMIFKDNLISLGGFSTQLKNSSALNLFIPILKADFKMIENYHYIPDQDKWDFPLTIFSGTYDETTSQEKILKWADYTNAACDFIEFPDDHFFINNKIFEITSTLNSYVEKEGALL